MFMRYRGNNICPDKQTNAAGKIMSLLTLLGDESMKRKHGTY